ncbi:hypothetical protein VTN02DRAFT_873 [Thermoascus thermophilus]
MARQRRVSLAIPGRTSIAQPEQLSSRQPGREDLGLYDKRSKASKVLGTTEDVLNQVWPMPGDRRTMGRASILKTAESRLHEMTSSSHLAPDSGTPSNHLRVRASSPLLGHSFRSREQPSFPSSDALAKPHHKSGTSSASQTSHGAQKSHESQQASVTPPELTELPLSDERLDRGAGAGNHEERPSRRKARPPRIDLSLLFPKPRAPSAPLLSPQRMTNSPSPVSVSSETSVGQPQKSDRAHPTENKSTTQSGDYQKRGNRVTDQGPTRTEKDPTDWFDAAIEKAMQYAGDDVEPEQNQDRTQQASVQVELERRNSSSSRPSVQQQSKRESSRSSATVTVKRALSSTGSMASRNTETHVSPKPMKLFPSQIQTSIETWQNAANRSASRASRCASRQSSHRDVKSSVSKKRSKNTLKHYDLHQSSVLWLSSSEDEDEDEEEPVKSSDKRPLRDSVTTYGDNEPEICTAETMRATKACAPTVDNPHSSRSREARRAQRRYPSASPAGRPSSRYSRRQSEIPTISEAEESIYEESSSQQALSPPARTLSPPSQYSNRRSRLMAVTRQEESLLEAVRQRKGKITPSLFNEVRFNAQDSDQASMLSSQPRDSIYSTYPDMSFLRLSPGIPPYRSDQGASYMEKEGSISQATTSDSEQRTDIMSPRVSLIYSDTIPSPSTSQPSPLTPTLPIHRFSPPAQPPPFPLPPVPDQQRRHSRRRTDSSEAIVINDGENEKNNNEPEFPVWALGWNKDGDLTIVG